MCRHSEKINLICLPDSTASILLQGISDTSWLLRCLLVELEDDIRSTLHAGQHLGEAILHTQMRSLGKKRREAQEECLRSHVPQGRAVLTAVM